MAKHVNLQGPAPAGCRQLCCLPLALALAHTGQWRCLGVGDRFEDRSGQWFHYDSRRSAKKLRVSLGSG